MFSVSEWHVFAGSNLKIGIRLQPLDLSEELNPSISTAGLVACAAVAGLVIILIFNTGLV